MELCVIKDKESRYYTSPPKESKGWASYCCFILLGDQRLLLAKRTKTFYCSFVLSCFTKHKEKEKEIIDAIRNFNLFELIDFILCMVEQGLLKNYFTNKELQNMSRKFSKKIFRNVDLSLLSKEIILEISKIVDDFYDIYFLKNKNNNLRLETVPTIILPGGKKDPIDVTAKETIIREVREEINLDISDGLVLNEDFEFTPISATKDNFRPILECVTEDIVLKKKYIDKIFVIKVKKHFNEIDFKPNNEIASIHSLPIDATVKDVDLLKHLISLKNHYR